MSINLRFPNITGFTEAEQINQIKSYLHQLVQQLNWALSNLENGTASGPVGNNPTDFLSEENVLELKALLIQSSSTLNSYYEKINGKLEGYYLKQADFEAYQMEVSQMFEGLANQYESKGDFEAYQQSIAQTINGHVLNTAFDSYKQANGQAVAGLQGEIESLRQMINNMQNTGGD